MVSYKAYGRGGRMNAMTAETLTLEPFYKISLYSDDFRI